MTATPLSSGPVAGVLSASGSSPVLASSAGQPAVVYVIPSRLASPQLFGSTPTGSVKLMRSTDDGQTWAAASTLLANPHRPCSYLATISDTTPAQYRVDSVFSGGSMLYAAFLQGSLGSPFPPPIQCVEPGDPLGVTVGATTAQLLALIQAKTSPLTEDQITAGTKLYKMCRGGIATLSVASGASVGFDLNQVFMNGTSRVVRASSVQVLSIVDLMGNAVATTTSVQDPSTVYTPGATVNCRDLYAGDSSRKSTGAFDSSTYTAGIHGFTTLIEAALYASWSPANLAALGL